VQFYVEICLYYLVVKNISILGYTKIICDQVTCQLLSLSLTSTHQAISFFTSISMAFSNIYSSILLPFVKSYNKATNEKSRGIIVKNAADAVLKSRHLLKDKGIDLPNDLKQVCVFSLYLS
jgi:hypothetical protein